MATRIDRSQKSNRTTTVKEPVGKDVNVASLDDVTGQGGIKDRLGGQGSAGAEVIANLQEAGAIAPVMTDALRSVFAKVREGLSERFGVQLFELDAFMADASENANSLLEYVHAPLSLAVNAAENPTTSITASLASGIEAERNANAIVEAAKKGMGFVGDMGWPMPTGDLADALDFLKSGDKIGELTSIWQGIRDAVTTGIDEIKELANAKASLGDALKSMKKGDKVTLYGNATISGEVSLAGRTEVEIERLNDSEPAEYAVRHMIDFGIGVGGEAGDAAGGVRAHGLVELVQVVEGGDNALQAAMNALKPNGGDVLNLVENGLPEGVAIGGRLKASAEFAAFSTAWGLTQKTALLRKDGKVTGLEQIFSAKGEIAVTGKEGPLSTTVMASQYELTGKIGSKDGKAVAEGKLSMEFVLNGQAHEISFELDFLKLSADDQKALYAAVQSADPEQVGNVLAEIGADVAITLKSYDKRDAAFALSGAGSEAEVGIETNLGTKERTLKFPLTNLHAQVTQQRSTSSVTSTTKPGKTARSEPNHHLEHIVEKGDSISRILQDLDIEPTPENIAQFVAMNREAWGQRAVDADKIEPGMKFVLPDIRPGDLAEIAKSAPEKAGDGVKAMNQGDYKNYHLGNSKRSIAASGCFITSLAMVASKLVGGDIDPAKANALILKGKGFSGASIYAPKASKALGLKMDARKKYSPAMRAKLDQALAEGRPAVVGVDYKKGHSSGFSNADHFLTITGKNADGSYRAIDPAGGKAITLRPNAQGDLVAKVGKKNYRVAEVAIFSKAKDAKVA